MFLIDTNIISEISNFDKANKQVIEFFKAINRSKQNIYFSVITIGELRRGVNLIRHKGDVIRADKLDA